jgi:RNA polymerase sigma-70 factor (ECF subfamily)
VDTGRQAEILLMIKNREKEAFRALYDEYYEDLLLYCHRIVGDIHAAEDVVQGSFVHWWHSGRLERFSGDLDRYLFRAVRNRSLKYKDQRQKVSEAERSVAAAENDGSSVTAWDQESVDRLYYHIHQLPEKCRRVFLMACLDDKPYRQVAEELGVSINTVKTQMKIALKYLRENLRGRLFLNMLFLFSKKDQGSKMIKSSSTFV